MPRCTENSQLILDVFGNLREGWKRVKNLGICTSNVLVHTEPISWPLVWYHECWMHCSSLCLRPAGIWWNRSNSRIFCICWWYRAVPEYNRWIMALTFPNMLAYIKAEMNRFKMVISSNKIPFVGAVLLKKAWGKNTNDKRKHLHHWV